MFYQQNIASLVAEMRLTEIVLFSPKLDEFTAKYNEVKYLSEYDTNQLLVTHRLGIEATDIDSLTNLSQENKDTLLMLKQKALESRVTALENR